MDVDFEDEKLRVLCSSFKKMQGRLGQPVARKMKRHINALQIAKHLEELRHRGGLHELDHDLVGHLAMHLADGKRLLFQPDPPAAVGEAVGVWAEVTAVKIIAIENYHQG